MTLRPIQVVRRNTSSVEQIHADIQSYFINAHFDILPEERRARRRTHTTLVLQDVRIEQFEPVGGELSGIGGEFYHVGYVSQGAILVKRGVNDVLNVPGGVGTLDSPGRPSAARCASRAAAARPWPARAGQLSTSGEATRASASIPN